MFHKPLVLILTILSMETMASTLKIEYGFNKYSFDIEEKTLTFTKKSHSSTIESSECGKNLFNKFKKRITDLAEALPENKKASLKEDGTEFPVKYLYQNKKGEVRGDSSTGMKLLSLPKEFDNTKLAIRFRCEGDKK